MSVKCAFLTRSFYRYANSLRRSGSPVTAVCVLSRLAVSDSLWCSELWPAKPLCPWDSPDKNTGVGCHPLRQGIFLTQGESLHLFRLQFERGITNPDQSDIPEVRIASLDVGRGGQIQKKKKKKKTQQCNSKSKFADLWPKLSAQMMSCWFSPSRSQATWKLPSPERITLRALSTSVDYTSQNTELPHPPARFRFRPRCFLGVVVSNSTGVEEVGKSPGGKPTWHKDLGWE